MAKSIKSLQTVNGKIVRHEGSVYRFYACTLGRKTLVTAESIFGPNKGAMIHLDREKNSLASTLRNMACNGLVS